MTDPSANQPFWKIRFTNLVMWTIGAGTILMALSMFVPGKPDASKDVLPFATGLLGFLGGLVTAMFGIYKQGQTDRSDPSVLT